MLTRIPAQLSMGDCFQIVSIAKMVVELHSQLCSIRVFSVLSANVSGSPGIPQSIGIPGVLFIRKIFIPSTLLLNMQSNPYAPP